MTAPLAIESPQQQASTESLLWSFEFANVLGTDTLSSVTSVSATKLADGSSATAILSGSAAISGTTKATQRVLGLAAGQRYLVVVTVQTVGGNKWAAGLQLECPF